MTSSRTRIRALPVLAAGVLSCFVATTAFAADRPPPLKLDYAVSDDADGCPDETGLRAMIAARLGYDPFKDVAKRTIVTRIRKATGKFRTRIELRDESGKLLGVRELDASTCTDLAASTSFAMAVAIDPEEANAPRPPPSPSPAPPTPAPTMTADSEKQPSPPVAPTPAPPPRHEPWTPTLFVGGYGGALGPYAQVAFGGGLGLMLDHGALGLGLEASASLPNTVTVNAANTQLVRTGVMGLSPLVCARASGLSLCGRVFLGAFQGAAEGVDAPDKKTTFFSSAGLRASYRIRPFGAGSAPSPFAVEPFLGADVVLTRTRVTFRGVEVWSTAPVTLEGGLRVAYTFF